jgi:ABC-2 type transport system permease protein
MMREIAKEMRYGLRNGRFLILAAGFLFFAMLTPVMMKLVVPTVMQSQMPGISPEVLSQMFQMTQIQCIQSYMGDVFEIGSVIVAFTLCGLLAQEIKDNTLVLPLCSGKRFIKIAGAKLLVFGTAMVVILTTALAIDYAYAGLLFSFDIEILPIIRGGLLQGVYMVFLIASLIMWGAVIKKPIAAGFTTLAVAYGASYLGSLLNISAYLPSGLLNTAMNLGATPAPAIMQNLLITIALIMAFMGITLLKLRHMEWNQR